MPNARLPEFHGGQAEPVEAPKVCAFDTNLVC